MNPKKNLHCYILVFHSMSSPNNKKSFQYPSTTTIKYMLRARYVMRVTNFAVPDGRRIATTEQCHNPCAPRPKSTVRTNSTTFNNVTQNCNFVVSIDVFFLLLFSFVFHFFFVFLVASSLFVAILSTKL